MARETVALLDPAVRRARLVLGPVRLTTTVVATLLASIADHPGTPLAWLLPAAMCGALAWAQPERSWVWRGAVLVEVTVAALGVPFTGGTASALLPYLLGPLFAVGFRSGASRVAAAAAWAAALIAGGLLHHDVPDERAYLVSAVQWCALGAAFGLVAAWSRALLASDDPGAPYAHASRLLSDLRGVARRLPGTLDRLTAAESLLDDLAGVAAYDRAAVYLPTSTGRMTPLAVRGSGQPEADPSTSGDGPVAQAWRERAVVRETAGGSALAIPVLTGDERIALVLLESAVPDAFPAQEARAAGRVVGIAAARLESALLFDEVRRLATVEERQRLAREIHDGIAQDLVYVGYELDALGAEMDAGRGTPRETTRRVRDHVTRIVDELRLSIFTLRTTVEPGGLGAALGEHVRSVATPAGIAVHLSVSEEPGRLSSDAEAELLRVAQEAVANARKHSGARNLWVTLTVDPPRALLRVDDDGCGIDVAARRGFGLDIMRERAERLGGRLAVAPREPSGTRVELEI